MDTPKKLDGIRVLCIDDDADMRALLAVVFIRHGAKVTLCSSAEEGINRLAKERFDIVISDLDMPPGLDGYDLVHALRQMEDNDEMRRVTPTVMVSANALEPSLKRHFADFQVYMQKPYKQARLIAVVERLIEADGEAVKLGSLAEWEAKQIQLPR